MNIVTTATTCSYYPFQVEGIEFLCGVTKAGKPHKLLADAPGVGKTVQTCGALVTLGAKSALIICPSVNAIKTSWRRHLVEWGVCKYEDVVILQSGKDPIPTEPKFVIVGLELLDQDQVYRGLAWGKYDVVVIDEVHKLKATQGKRAKRILGGGNGISLSSRGLHKIALTGSPMPNRLIEMYPLLATWCPEAIAPHTKYQDYGKYFCNGFWDGEGGKYGSGEWNFKGASHVDEFRQRLIDSGFYLRREVREVFPDMPDLIDRKVVIDIGTLVEDESNTPTATLRQIVGVAKVPDVVEYIKYKLEDVPKILVFTYHREVSEGIYHAMKSTAELVYGGMSNDLKDRALQLFLHDPEVTVLVAQRNSLGTGVDGIQLATNYIIEAEPDWSAGGYEQEYSRVWRHGQTEPVYIDSVIAENTIDDTVYQVRERKNGLLDRVIRNTTNGVQQMSLEDAIKENTAAVKELTATLKAGVAATASGAEQEAPKAQEKPADKKAAAKKEEKAEAKNGAKGAASSNGTPAVTWEQVEQAAGAAMENQTELHGEDVAIEKGKEVVEACGMNTFKEIAGHPDKWQQAFDDFTVLANEKPAAKAKSKVALI